MMNALFSQQATSRQYCLGVTLLELLFALAIFSLICLIGLPLSQSLMRHNKMDVVVNDIKSAIRYARNMALVRGEALALIPLSQDWSTGMRLVVDNNQHQYSQKDEVIHQWQWHYPGMQVRWQGFRSNDFLIFTPILKQSATSGHFVVNQQGRQQTLIVNRIARVVIQDMVN